MRLAQDLKLGTNKESPAVVDEDDDDDEMKWEM